MKKWQPSLDKRPKADEVYQRRLRNNEKAMGNACQHNGSLFSPLAEIHDEPEMNWQNNTMRQVDDAKEMDTTQLPRKFVDVANKRTIRNNVPNTSVYSKETFLRTCRLKITYQKLIRGVTKKNP